MASSSTDSPSAGALNTKRRRKLINAKTSVRQLSWRKPNSHGLNLTSRKPRSWGSTGRCTVQIGDGFFFDGLALGGRAQHEAQAKIDQCQNFGAAAVLAQTQFTRVKSHLTKT